MSRKYTFSLAQESDDDQLRILTKGISFPGSIEVAFHKEPNFFRAEKIGALLLDVLTVRESESGQIVGSACRSTRRVFINGKSCEVGYLSGLKGYSQVRNGMLLARGYQEIKKMCTERETPFCFTTIFSENDYAKSIITSGRANLPAYKRIGRLRTYVMNPKCFRAYKPNGRISIVRGSMQTLDKIVAFINACNRELQFAPCYCISDFNNSAMFPCFNPDQFYVACVGEEIVGTMGLWDQTALKQIVITGYHGTLSFTKPFYNVGSSIGCGPKLPKVNEQIPSLYASFVAIKKPYHREVFDALLRTACLDVDNGERYIFLGLNSEDRLCEVPLSYPHFMINSEMYVVYWKDMEGSTPDLDGRMAHFEIATL